MTPTPQTGVLIVNLGSPDGPQTKEVRTFLKEFLSDPRVVDLPSWARALLLNVIILPFRSRRSAHAYSQIWTPEGSPLILHTRALRDELTKNLGEHYIVEFAMRYGKPTLEAARERFAKANVGRVVVLPLYPQYATSSTGTSLEKIYKIFGEQWNVTPLQVVGPFYKDSGFLNTIVARGRPLLEQMQPDHVLFSFHGLPQRHLKKSGVGSPFCYQTQCFETAQLLAEKLNLLPEKYTVSFQSRIGRAAWTKPYTEQIIKALNKKGTKKLLVFSPSFAADCLETLEELGIRGRDQFLKGGGEEFKLVPSLNATREWVDAAGSLIRKAAGDTLASGVSASTSFYTSSYTASPAVATASLSEPFEQEPRLGL